MEMHVLGKNVVRVDAKAKATGDAHFTVDVHLDGMIHAKFLRSPHPHARIRSIDVSAARRLPGVCAAVTHTELQGMRLHNDLCDDTIHYLGEAVAGVAAESEDTAEEALELVKAEYELLPELLDAAAALDPGVAAIWGRGNVCTWRGPQHVTEGSSISWEKGDVEKALAEADVVAECEMDTHGQFHGCLEPHACVASWDAGLEAMTWRCPCATARVSYSWQGRCGDGPSAGRPVSAILAAKLLPGGSA